MKVAVALDVKTYVEATYYINLLQEFSPIFKIGLEYFIANGPRIFEDFPNLNFFLDLKLHDIPNTMACSAHVIAKFSSVSMFTIHADAGSEAIAAVKSSVGKGKSVLAVTNLTSANSNVLSVLKKTETAINAGADGVIASAHESAEIRNQFGSDILIITPGIRPLWHNTPDDQKRIATPQNAKQNGANIIVIGRPILQHENPKIAMQMVLDEIAE